MSNRVQLKLFTLEEAEKHVPTYCPACRTHKTWFTLNHFMDVNKLWWLKYRCTNCGWYSHFQCAEP